MKNEEKIDSSEMTEEGLQQYVANVSRRYELVDQILQGVREGNEHQAMTAMEEFCGIHVPGRLEDERMERRYELFQIKALMTQALRECGVEVFYLEKIHTEYMQKIDKMENTDEIFRRLSVEMVRDYCNMTRLKSFRNYSLLVQKIILTVDIDLGQPLTLKYFADRLNVNGSYLSSLFHRETGMTITEYVTSRRIQRAANLLQTSHIPVKTVAKQVGINDVNYFGRLFKKQFGQTPSQYRDGLKNRN